MSPRDLRSPDSLLPLKSHWFHVLLSVADRDQHGYGIMQEVLERTDGKVRLWPATLYGSLRRLLDEDLIEECDRRPSTDADDLRRRYYRLTPFGRRVLAAEIARLEELLKAARVKRRAFAAGMLDEP
jgi:DNA-binding PadR family transcriptional regulator